MFQKGIFTVRMVEPLPSPEIEKPNPSQSGFNQSNRKDWKNILKKWIKDSFYNYCETTSLHGFNYIIRPGITSGERFFWIFVVVAAIITSIILLTISWIFNRETPTVTVIESSNFPTWNVPFPAVTLCNFNRISKQKAMNLAKKMVRFENITDSQIAELFRISMYYSLSVNYTVQDFNRLDTLLKMNYYTGSRLNEELTPDCMDMITRCIWKGTNSRCDSLFQRVNTTLGICCSFNYFGMATNNFPPKLGYQVPKVPFRVTGCGYTTGLTVVLNPEIDDYFGTYVSSYGFRLLIHDAYDFPDDNAEMKVLRSARESFVGISPESAYATPDINSMPVSMRQCLFSTEKKLQVMQRYSYINCLMECRVSIIHKRCGCVPLNLPNNGSYPVCSYAQFGCVIANQDVLLKALPNLNHSLIVGNSKFVTTCDCLPDCELNQYPSEITTGIISTNFTGNNIAGIANTSTGNKMVLHVFYSDLMSVRYRTDIYQNWLSMLASFGGLLGLIMGFSIVTAFEFLYYFFLRPLFHLKKR